VHNHISTICCIRAQAFDHPRNVVTDADLTLNEKRAILASWASDACAVEAAPALRHAPGGRRPVSVDEILEALQALDRRQGRSDADTTPIEALRLGDLPQSQTGWRRPWLRSYALTTCERATLRSLSKLCLALVNFAGMSQFYFDIREGGRLIPHDEDGLEFANLDDAEREAGLTALEIARDVLPTGKAGEVKVEVHDEQRQHVMTVTVSIGIRRQPGCHNLGAAPFSRGGNYSGLLAWIVCSRAILERRVPQEIVLRAPPELDLRNVSLLASCKARRELRRALVLEYMIWFQSLVRYPLWLGTSRTVEAFSGPSGVFLHE
jgi:hypothetical protein